MNYKFYLPDDEHIHHAETIEDAKSEIFDRTIDEESVEHTVVINCRPYSFDSIEDAKAFALLWNGDLFPATKI